LLNVKPVGTKKLLSFKRLKYVNLILSTVFAKEFRPLSKTIISVFFGERNLPLLITLYDYSRHSALFHVVPKNLQWDFARRISGELLPPLEYCSIFYLSETDINIFFCFYQFIIRKEKAMVTLITK
jgi:hypothetical protein